MNKNGKVDHRLYPSDADLMSLCAAVSERFQQVEDLFQRTRGYPLLTPEELGRDMFNWGQLMNRYSRSDFRHKTDEKKSLRRIAQWTLSIKQQLCSQPVTTLEWKD